MVSGRYIKDNKNGKQLNFSCRKIWWASKDFLLATGNDCVARSYWFSVPLTCTRAIIRQKVYFSATLMTSHPFQIFGKGNCKFIANFSAKLVTSLPSLPVSLSLSLSPKVPHAQYRKRFRASYNTHQLRWPDFIMQKSKILKREKTWVSTAILKDIRRKLQIWKNGTSTERKRNTKETKNCSVLLPASGFLDVFIPFFVELRLACRV